MPAGYQTLSIPKRMYEDIVEFIINNPRLGYTSAPEFVKDAIRKNLGVTEPSKATATLIENAQSESPLVDSIGEIYELMRQQKNSPIQFRDVILASTHHEIKPFSMTDDIAFLGVLEASIKRLKIPEIQSSSTLENKPPILHQLIEDQLIDYLEKNGVRVEILAGAGYPDLAVDRSNVSSGDTIYITLKVSTDRDSHKEFYYVGSRKIRDYGIHLLIDIVVNARPDEFKKITHYCVRDLSTMALVLDVEFRASSKNIHNTATALIEFPMEDRNQRYPT